MGFGVRGGDDGEVATEGGFDFGVEMVAAVGFLSASSLKTHISRGEKVVWYSGRQRGLRVRVRVRGEGGG